MASASSSTTAEAGQRTFFLVSLRGEARIDSRGRFQLGIEHLGSLIFNGTTEAFAAMSKDDETRFILKGQMDGTHKDESELGSRDPTADVVLFKKWCVTWQNENDLVKSVRPRSVYEFCLFQHTLVSLVKERTGGSCQVRFINQDDYRALQSDSARQATAPHLEDMDTLDSLKPLKTTLLVTEDSKSLISIEPLHIRWNEEPWRSLVDSRSILSQILPRTRRWPTFPWRLDDIDQWSND